MKQLRLIFLLLAMSVTSVSFAQRLVDEHFTVESYYKVKWGLAGEFLDLYKKNTLPLFKKALDKGDLISIKLESPRQHGTEEGRWDYRVTLVYKNLQTAFDPNFLESYKKALYPDLDKLKHDEQRRFEILLAHWDVIVQAIDL